MNRLIGFTLLFLLAPLVSVSQAVDRPNIVWISCEDISPNMGCYGDPHAITPNLDRLASEGVRFNRAFTVSHGFRLPIDRVQPS